MAAATPPVVGYLLCGDVAGDAAIDRARDYAAFLDALGAYSPTVEPDPPGGCWLDLRAGKRAPAVAIRAAAPLATARDWGYPLARLGVAPTPGVARLAACHGLFDVTLLNSIGEVAAFLAPLSLGGVGLGAEQAERLALVGLRTLGDVTALRRGALGDYLGVAGPALEALARGVDDRPLVPTRPPLVLTARRELDWAVTDRAQLDYLLDALLAPLLGQLRRQGLGATRATLTLGTGRAKPTRYAVALARPTASVAPVLAALLEALSGSLDREDAGGGETTLALELIAPRPLVGRKCQNSGHTSMAVSILPTCWVDFGQSPTFNPACGHTGSIRAPLFIRLTRILATAF